MREAKGFEQVNVKGVFNLAHSFLPTRSPRSVFIGVSAGSIQVGALSANFSAYNASKFAAVKALECVASETPDLHVVNMHPGVGRKPEIDEKVAELIKCAS